MITISVQLQAAAGEKYVSVKSSIKIKAVKEEGILFSGKEDILFSGKAKCIYLKCQLTPAGL